MQKFQIFYFIVIGFFIISVSTHAQEILNDNQPQQPNQSEKSEQVFPEQSDSLLVNDSKADTIGIVRRYNGVFGSFSYGWTLLNTRALNETLNSFNYPMFSNYAVTFGGRALRMYKCFFIGAEGYFIFNEEKNSTAYDASLNSGYVFFNMGYRGIASSNLLLYPLIGVGGGRSNLKIAERSNGIAFNQLMANPARSLELSTNSFLLNFSLNLDYFTMPILINGFHFGISLGYTLALPADGWFMFNTNVQGGPAFNLSGPYIRLKFGGGSFTNS
ncbi:MAG: hypothetical protein M3Q58_09320 [Bacteroidota bacterium]|nr:hypothetical protein [Bacteroidota bacterium]